MIGKQDIIDFFDKQYYDIHKNGNGRWIDQKCTADIVTVVIDCIYNYELNGEKEIFTTADI